MHYSTKYHVSESRNVIRPVLTRGKQDREIARVRLLFFFRENKFEENLKCVRILGISEDHYYLVSLAQGAPGTFRSAGRTLLRAALHE